MAHQQALRLWPGVGAVALQWILWFILPIWAPETTIVGVFGGLIGGLVVLLWWAFFSRAPWPDRVGAVLLMVAGLFVTSRLLHVSIATGSMGMVFPIYAIPALSLAFVASVVASRGLAAGPRRALMAAVILVACGFWVLLRTDGITGDFHSQFHWRWTKTAEQQLVAKTATVPEKTTDKPEPPLVRAEPAPAPVAPPTVEIRPQWPGFRGPARDNTIRGVRISADWTASPPEKLWRHPVGPGWSSFAVQGDRFYTQEQRGDDEIVACYRVGSGELVWTHRDAARFWESNGGAGPRATPTLHNGRVYTFGATGILNSLDARNGKVVWSRNAAADTEKKVPSWGFAGSPLVVGDAVIVAAAGRLAAYDLALGKVRWLGPAGGAGYSSPHLATIGGQTQVLLVNGAGIVAVAPADGTLLWKHEWPGDGIIQPALIADGDVLIGSGSGLGDGSKTGTLRFKVAQGPSGWTVEERWTSIGLKPYFSDFVVHNGHAYGFDGSILACIDLQDGKRKWKGGRYGHGQLVLLPDQDLLLVLSEEGELALVKATPDQFTELARLPAIEGKTWNHPVLAGNILLVRNSEEMAAFRVSLASR
ncbi:MAG: PQQ-binding-like beta-propeller repeat protein [Bryobacterales bacterium]|nr:PQQ-binding-like beta-propeller repeat protein [Bryobacterales bacterium]